METRPPFLPTFVASVIACWFSAWLLFGNNLGFDVYGEVNGVRSFMYSEQFTPGAKVVVTTIVSFLVGLPLAAVVRLARVRRAR